MSRGATALAALLVTLGRPSWWLLGLAAFLVRGGVLLFLIPIVALPSPLALSNAAAPTIMAAAFGRISPELIGLVVALVLAGLAWLLAGGLLAAAADLALLREATAAAAEEGVGHLAVAERPGIARRILAARILALVPFVVAVIVGTVGIVGSAYVELTRPRDVDAPLALRVLAGAVWHVVGIIVTWVFAEVVGGAAERRVVFNATPPFLAVSDGTVDLVRRPVSIGATWIVATIVLLALAGANLLASGIAWDRLRALVVDRNTEPLWIGLALLGFVGTWLAALTLAGIAGSARTALLVFEEVRARSRVGLRPGTYGAGTHRRPGDWSVGDEGGSL